MFACFIAPFYVNVMVEAMYKAKAENPNNRPRKQMQMRVTRKMLAVITAYEEGLVFCDSRE